MDRDRVIGFFNEIEIESSWAIDYKHLLMYDGSNEIKIPLNEIVTLISKQTYIKIISEKCEVILLKKMEKI